MTRTAIDGNGAQRSADGRVSGMRPTEQYAVIWRMKVRRMQSYCGRRPGRNHLHPKESSCTRNTLVPTSCTSRVVGDSERDPPHLELIHPVIGEAAPAQATITHQQSYRAQLPYRPIHTHHSAHSEFYSEGTSHPSRLSSPSKDMNAFLTVYL